MRRFWLALMLIGWSVVPARAELVFFSSGRTLSVKSHAIEGDSLVFLLRGGGELVCQASLVERIAPDEVPYPDEPLVAMPGPTPGAAVPRAPLQTDPRFDPIIRKAAAAHGVDAELVRAVIQVESAYRPRARSPKGAVGLMQVMPATGRLYGILNLYDPVSNIDAGIRHLKTLLDRFPLAVALAAYNAGQAAVERFQGVPPYRETQAYVSRILALVGD